MACEKGETYLIWTVTYHGEHKQRLLLNHIKSLPELIRYLEHLPFHYLIHSLLLQMLEFFYIETVFQLIQSVSRL